MIVAGVRFCVGRSPHGERGLKCVWSLPCSVTKPSLSSWRAWIEILMPYRLAANVLRRSPHGERGLKWASLRARNPTSPSLSSWRAWIEIAVEKANANTAIVALLMESVD